MKIGILTYQYAKNYGALLQAYALKNYLQSLGNDVEILNYDTSYLYAKNRSVKTKIVSFAWSCVRTLLGGKKKEKELDKFRVNNLELKDNVLKNHSDIENYVKENKFDAFIVGSDQVWNPQINGHDSAYYLDFAENQLKISYAASFGVSSVNENDLFVIDENLKSFNAISVREKTGLNILKNLNLSVTPKVVLDPVFLPDLNLWNDLAGERIIKEKYVLCYVMPGDKVLENKISETAKEYSKRTNCKIVYIGRKEFYKFKNDGKDIFGASPKDFVNLFKYADFTVTNSFHGTAFSLIFSKQFYSLVNAGLSGEEQLGSRIVDLLTSIDLDSRILESKDKCDFSSVIDYEAIRDKLGKLKEESKSFLNETLK